MTSALPLACGQPEIYFFNHGIKYTLFSFGETKTTPILQITQVDWNFQENGGSNSVQFQCKYNKVHIFQNYMDYKSKKVAIPMPVGNSFSNLFYFHKNCNYMIHKMFQITSLCIVKDDISNKCWANITRAALHFHIIIEH